MRMSRKHTSGRSASALLDAPRAPSPTIATTSQLGPQRGQFGRSAAASSGSSSAIRAVGVGHARSPAARSMRASVPPSARRLEQLKRGAVAVQRGQALAHLLQAEARAAAWPAARAGRRRCRAPSAPARRRRARAPTSMRPPSTFGSRPCWMLFSTSGCSSSGGTGSVAQRGGQVERDLQPRPHAHAPSAPGSRPGVELGRQRVRADARCRSSVARRKAISRSSMACARGGSSAISTRRLASVLNSMCGSSCDSQQLQLVLGRVALRRCGLRVAGRQARAAPGRTA